MATASAAFDRLNATALGRFGVECTLDGFPIQADYVAGVKEQIVGGMPVAAREPMATVQDQDLPVAPVGKVFTHPTDGSYKVMEVRADGLGLSILVLQKGR